MKVTKALAAALPLMLVAAACGSTSSSGSGGGGFVISSDLPLQGASADASKDTNLALKQYLASQGGKAGKYTITLKEYDNATADAAYQSVPLQITNVHYRPSRVHQS